MIPKIIHYCWFGQSEMPEEAKECIASWHKFMPDYEYRLWNEDNFDVNGIPYTKEAYAVKKFAFVSDYVRLMALCKEGGIYLDTDVEVFKPFDDLLEYNAFAGFEGSKSLPLGTCVMASAPDGIWVKEQLSRYQNRHFIIANEQLDLTTNVQFITNAMCNHGFIQDGKEQCYKDLHVFPVDYFSPRRTTGEYFRTENTYCDHLGLNSWGNHNEGWKERVRGVVGNKNMIRLIKMKRCLFG